MDVMNKFIPWASPKLFGLEKKLIKKAIKRFEIFQNASGPH